MNYQDATIAIKLIREIVSDLEDYFRIEFTDITDQDSTNHLCMVCNYSVNEYLEIKAPIDGEPCIVHNQNKNNRVPIGRENEFLQGFRERLFEFLIRMRKLHQF